jgi:DNA-binding CsgD family transcriptional regulator/tetratricopeptide (TPR) repeat protein
MPFRKTSVNCSRVLINQQATEIDKVYDLRMARLLERDADLARLVGALDDAADGHGRIAFVAGDAGIGKSTVVAEFVAMAGTATTAVGRCDPLATPRALGPFLDVATALGLDAPADRDSLLGTLVDALARAGPTVIVVEDAHWADDATLEVLAMLGRRAADLPLVLVVTYRDSEVGSDHTLRRVIGDLVTARATIWIGLGPLSPDAVAVLAAPHGADADELYDRTGGNPFFVTEVLASPDEEIPTTVRLAVLARAGRLDQATRAVVDAVSVVPGRAESWLVAATCEAPEPGLDSAVSAGVLVRAGEDIAFRHELARRTIEDALAEERRRALHARVLHALQHRGGIDPARLAHHARGAGEDHALATAARDAALLAARRTAHQEAVRHGEAALSVRGELDADDVAALQVGLVLPLIACARAEEAARLAAEAVEHWRGAGDQRREAQALEVLSGAVASQGRPLDAQPIVEQAVALLEQHPPGPELGWAYLRLTSLSMLARDRDSAVCWGERAIELATELGDMNLLGRALVEAGIADVMDARFEGLRRVREAIALGRRHDLPGVVSSGLLQIGSGCGEMRRYDEAVPALVEGMSHSAAHHFEANRQYDVAWLARCRFDLGEWDEVEPLCMSVINGPSPTPISRFVALNTLGWLRTRRGDGDPWMLLDDALSIARRMGHLQRLWPVAVARAEAAALEGSLDEHLDLLDEVFDLAARCRHGIAVGQLAVWLARGGRLADPPPGAADPFAAWIAGDHQAAAAGFRRQGCPYEVADVLAGSGDTSSIREAHATFTRLGAVPMAEVTAAELRRRGARPLTRRSGGSDTGGLSGREVEVLELVAAGFTNPQIADALYISRKTAEHHVSSILAKLGVSGRSEAAAAAVRLGIAAG